MNLGKIFATIAHDVVVGAKAVEKFLLKQGQSLQEIDARVPAIESASKRLLGDALAAAADAAKAGSASGFNLPVDAAFAADLVALGKDLKDELAAFGVKL